METSRLHYYLGARRWDRSPEDTSVEPRIRWMACVATLEMYRPLLGAYWHTYSRFLHSLTPITPCYPLALFFYPLETLPCSPVGLTVASVFDNSPIILASSSEHSWHHMSCVSSLSLLPVYLSSHDSRYSSGRSCIYWCYMRYLTLAIQFPT